MLIAESKNPTKAGSGVKFFLICFFIFWSSFFAGSGAVSFAKEDKGKELNHCLIQARIQHDNSRYKEAIEWWNKALSLDPQNKEALKYIKKAQEKVSRLQEDQLSELTEQPLKKEAILSVPATLPNENKTKEPLKPSPIPPPQDKTIDVDQAKKVLKETAPASGKKGFKFLGIEFVAEESPQKNKKIKDAPRKDEAPAGKSAQDKTSKVEQAKSGAGINPPPDTKKGFKFLGIGFVAEDVPQKDRKKKDIAGRYILQGRKYYVNGRYNWALSEWRKALKVDPGNAEVQKYAERATERLKQKPAERKPIESDMILKKPEPENPEPVFQKPSSGAVSLKDAVTLGLQNSLSVRIAKEQVKLSRLKEKEAFRELFPQATVRWDETQGIVSSKNYAGRKYQLKVQHPLYSGGELQYTWEQAKVNLKISHQNYEKTKEDYVLQLSRAYHDYVKAIKNMEIQDALLKDLEKDIGISKKEYEAKLTGLVEFLNVQSSYNQAYYSSLSSQNTLSLAKSNFLQLLNLDNDKNLNIKLNTDLVFKDYNIDLEKCIEVAYEQRTDLKINELGLRSAELGEKVTQSQQLPKVDLTGTIGKSGEAYTPGTVQMSNDWFVGAKVSVPWGPNNLNYSLTRDNVAPSISVFQPTKSTVSSIRLNLLDNLASYTEAKRSEVNREQAYADFLKGKQTAATEVREAYFNYQETAIKVKNSIANKELYKKELDIVKEKRSINDAQTQDVVSAKVKLSGEESGYISVLVENIEALEKLNKAMGVTDYFKVSAE